MLDPTFFQTPRLLLQRPTDSDLPILFQTVCSDPSVTRFVGWPRHVTIEDTKAFLAFSDSEWSRWPLGPLLIKSRENGSLIGTTGLAFETPYRASTGFVLSRSAWGSGLASESLTAVAKIAHRLGVQRLYALCHVDHVASIRVLERCRFNREGILSKYLVFPNLETTAAQDVCCYAHTH